MNDQTSGSEKLLAQLGGRCGLPKRGIENLVEVLREGDLKLVDWHCFGQPEPDFIQGSIQVRRDQAGGAVERLINVEELPLKLELFPIGIPVPELFEVAFKSAGR